MKKFKRRHVIQSDPENITFYERNRWLIYIIVIAITSYITSLFTSCSPQRCYPSKKSRDYAIINTKKHN